MGTSIANRLSCQCIGGKDKMNIYTTFLEGKEYYIIKKIVLNNCEYLYLSSVEDSNNFCIRSYVSRIR